MSSRFDRLDGADYPIPAEILSGVLSPALIVYVDHVRRNVRRVLEACGDDPRRWRPHVKTVKIPQVLAELARAGLRHFKCATIREARCLLDVLRAEGIDDGDVLIAYPLIGPALAAAGHLAAAHPASRLSVLCEDSHACAAIPQALGVFVDVNPGMNRTGVPADDLRRILAIAERCAGRFRGAHFYEGHLHGTDGTRRTSAFAAYERLLEIACSLSDSGVPARELVTSGTPTFLDALSFPGFDGPFAHRVSPGTVVYHDCRSEEEIPGLGLLPAALVLSRVISHPAHGIATCDAGSKSIAAEAGDPCAHVLRHPGLMALKPSEEHLPLRVVAGGLLPERGTPLLLAPRHVCPTVNLADQAVLVENGELREVVPVLARAHDVLDSTDA